MSKNTAKNQNKFALCGCLLPPSTSQCFAARLHRVYFFKPMCLSLMMFVCVFILSSCEPVQAYNKEAYLNQVVDAIYWAEGGASTRHPYGILSVKTSNPRQTCLDVVRYRYWQWSVRSERESISAKDRGVDFISFLQKSYCPVGADNDPTMLNVNWQRNVKYFMETSK